MTSITLTEELLSNIEKLGYDFSEKTLVEALRLLNNKPNRLDIVNLRWSEGKTFKEIGLSLGFTKQRASELFKDAKATIEAALDLWGVEGPPEDEDYSTYDPAKVIALYGSTRLAGTVVPYLRSGGSLRLALVTKNLSGVGDSCREELAQLIERFRLSLEEVKDLGETDAEPIIGEIQCEACEWVGDESDLIDGACPNGHPTIWDV